MNKVELIGNLCADPEVSVTQSGLTRCVMRLAVQRKFANQQGVRETDFLTIICWRQLAEFCGKYLSKGRKCAVIGSIQVRSYTAQDGTKRTATEILADEVEFVDSRPKSEAAQETAQETPPSSDGFVPVDDDELPF